MICSWRFSTTLLLLYSLVVGNLPKLSMGMALICMVDQSNTSNTNTNNSLETQEPSREYEFEWSSEILGLILASTNFTQFLSPILGDLVRRFIGNKPMIIIFYGISALTLFLTPTAARISPYAMMGMCMLQGFVIQANIVVSGDTLAWWSPSNEKLTLTAIMYSGFSLSGLIGNLLAGSLCQIPIDYGWPFIYYAFGTITMIFIILWMALYSRTPEDHRFVSEEERNYIIAQRSGMDNANKKKVDRPPYKQIFTSVPFWAFIVSGWCFFWALTGLFSYMPIFFSKSLKFPPDRVGLLIAMFSIVGFIANPTWATIGNKLRTRYDTNKSRKICIGIGYTLAAIIITTIANLMTTANRWVIYFMLLGCIFMLSVGSSTLTVVALDMAPKYAGFLTAVWMSSSTCITTTSPITMSILTANNTPEEWRNAWILYAAFCFTGCLVFIIFGQASLQPWAMSTTEGKKQNDECQKSSEGIKNDEFEHNRNTENGKTNVMFESDD